MKREAVVALVLWLSSGLTFGTRAEPILEQPQKGTAMTERATGTFEVKVGQLPNDDKVEGLTVGRNSLAKQFNGDFEGTGTGEMMSASTAVQGSAGYVAIERLSGTMKGRTGTFLLLHQGTMKNGGDFKLSIVVVPDSGTDGFTGLSGTMTIIIADGKHSYEFDYTLPAQRAGGMR